MSAKFYNENAEILAQQYLSKTFDEVHQSWHQLLPAIIENPNARILDIGAGSGRDAKYIALSAINKHGDINGTQVIAVEPANLLAELGACQTAGLNVKWLTDSLPALNTITKQEVSFDLILLSAVWMHIPVSARPRSIRKLANLLKPGGKLVISLRHSSDSEQAEQERKERKMHVVCADELKRLATDVGLLTKLETQKEDDKLGRGHVSWQTLVLQLPDDGTGAFPFIRHVAINDGKSATHKLALLRVLLRLADGHPGSVLRREPSPFGDRVILPVGLVALYWCHQYKDLIDSHKLFQRPGNNSNMGFMTANGWDKLTHLTASDYRIGNLFTGDDAKALYRTLSAAVQNIKKMPCTYITLPNSDKEIFEVANKTVKAKDSIFLDLQTLEQWGEFSLPESTWLAFNRYACWIEPVLVSEWVKTMAGYAGNAQYKSPENQFKLHQALNWEEPKRTTVEVRKRFEQLKKQSPNSELIKCVWSAKSLKQSYDIDHSMPFARWPNNDLWNLLPTDSSVNNQKSDRLPTEQKLKQAKERIQHWWQTAWLDDESSTSRIIADSSAFLLRAEPSEFLKNEQSQRFFAEANIALPGLSSDNSSVDDLFEALVMQRGRLKEMQQLREW
ncbi:class I SAM-dependent methyltransferase [Colwellia sp. BRX9-1]|uniref:class I SAM-dependent methyltransferase n=1 Tax=Colwellia sp. BRX9-1 TaxID=2759830 RepID=UPI0015F625E3|nr:class I SAM-dependent methyltransferase [Colwellia sp. BRX9-1]MBA6352496.1 methyltransferase domain-containing protein [Colwellia sp. BRX9-1]